MSSVWDVIRWRCPLDTEEQTVDVQAGPSGERSRLETQIKECTTPGLAEITKGVTGEREEVQGLNSGAL